MAAIDKIYLDSYNKFQLFKQWCKKQKSLKDKYGKDVKISDYLFHSWDDPKYWEDNNTHPVMNAPYYIDAYIIRNCPFGFIQDELMVNYGHWSQKRIKEFYDSVKNWNGEGECPYWAKLEDFIFNEDGTLSIKGLEKSDYELIKEGKIYDKPCIDKYERGKHFKMIKMPSFYKGNVCQRPMHGSWMIDVKLPDYVDEMYMNWNAHSNAKFPVGTWDFISEFVESIDGWSSSATHCKTIDALKRRMTKWKLPVGTIVRAIGRYVGEEYEFIIKK